MGLLSPLSNRFPPGRFDKRRCLSSPPTAGPPLFCAARWLMRQKAVLSGPLFAAPSLGDRDVDRMLPRDQMTWRAFGRRGGRRSVERHLLCRRDRHGDGLNDLRHDDALDQVLADLLLLLEGAQKIEHLSR